MTILCDSEIAYLCDGEHPMISPFVDKSVKVNDKGEKILS